MACGIHRNLKTGGIPWKEVLLPRQRHELYPTLYSEHDEETGMVQQTVERYATELMSPSAPTLLSRHRMFNNNSLINNKENFLESNSALNGSDALTSATTAMGRSIALTEPVLSSVATPMAVPSATVVGSTPVIVMSTPLLYESQVMSMEPPTPPPPPTPTMQTRSAIHQVDIWGRCPPKEPKQLVTCSVCNRQVSTSRFAPHLDKCMGVGTSTRAAAAAAAAAAANQANHNIANNNQNINSNSTHNSNPAGGNISGLP